MPYLIGTDEAGYGPNLGPLVVSATVWQVPQHVRGTDLYDRLADVISPKPDRNGRDRRPRVAMADSKRLYQSGGRLRLLECGLLAALGAMNRTPGTWSALWECLDPGSAEDRRELPWYAQYEAALPVDVDADELTAASEALRNGFAAAAVQILDIASRAVFPSPFNTLVEQHGSKGTALSKTTLQLTAELIERLPEGPIVVTCDKHGGRNKYRPLLEEQFPEQFVEVCGEGRRQSVYRFGPAARRVEIRFQTKAESWLPTALASMTSKYLRELAMRALNAYWSARVDGLHPTAGYPHDAKRFKAEIASVQSALGIEDRILWRVK